MATRSQAVPTSSASTETIIPAFKLADRPGKGGRTKAILGLDFPAFLATFHSGADVIDALSQDTPCTDPVSWAKSGKAAVWLEGATRASVKYLSIGKAEQLYFSPAAAEVFGSDDARAWAMAVRHNRLAFDAEGNFQLSSGNFQLISMDKIMRQVGGKPMYSSALKQLFRGVLSSKQIQDISRVTNEAKLSVFTESFDDTVRPFVKTFQPYTLD